jgi:23S rRNA (pseudouridine1915-N3)-methyltransferase
MIDNNAFHFGKALLFRIVRQLLSLGNHQNSPLRRRWRFNLKIQFWSIGKNNEAYIKAGVEEFTHRISKYYKVEWNLIPAPKNAGMLSEMDLKKKEGETILNLLSKDDYLVVLDERGKQLSSEGLAEFIQKRGNESAKNLIFLIGGAFGTDEKVLQRANFKWSLSQLVFPHQLVRMILAEQVYRACTILKNEKYHHK